MALLNHYRIPQDVAINDLTKEQIEIIKYGAKEEIEYVLISKDGNKYTRRHKIGGLITKLARLFLETTSDEMRQ